MNEVGWGLGMEEGMSEGDQLLVGRGGGGNGFEDADG